MKAIIKEGKDLLFLAGASGKNYDDVKDKLIVNFNNKGVYSGSFTFYKRSNTFIIETNQEEDIVIVFSSPIKDIIFDHWDHKDQVVFKVIK